MLRDIRKDQGYTMVGLAKESGVPLRTIENWERRHGIEHATIGNVLKVTKVLGCTIDDLLS